MLPQLMSPTPTEIAAAQEEHLEHEFCYVKRSNRLVVSVTANFWSSKIRLAMAKHGGREYARHCVVWHHSATAKQVDMDDFTSHEVRLVFRHRTSVYLAALDFSSSEKCTFLEVFRQAAHQTLLDLGVPAAWMDGVYMGME